MATLDRSPDLRTTPTTSLGNLPHELLHEIMSYIPCVPPPTAADNMELVEEHWYYQAGYLALSQTCHNLRRFFLPYAWQRIEVVNEARLPGPEDMWLKRNGGKEEDEKFMKELLRQLEVVTVLNPGLAMHVKIINVEIPVGFLPVVLEKLGSILALFSALHTIKLKVQTSGRADSVDDDSVARAAFRDAVYPAIHTAILSREAYPLLASCPNLSSFHCFDDFSTENILKYLRQPDDIKTLGCLLKPLDYDELLRHLPNIQKLSILFTNLHNDGLAPYDLDNEVIRTQLRLLSSLPHLQTLNCEGPCWTWDDSNEALHKWYSPVLHEVKFILRRVALPAPGRKWVSDWEMHRGSWLGAFQMRVEAEES